MSRTTDEQTRTEQNKETAACTAVMRCACIIEWCCGRVRHVTLQTQVRRNCHFLLNRAWRPGCSLGTNVHSALETFVTMRYINLHLPYHTIPYHTIPYQLGTVQWCSNIVCNAHAPSALYMPAVSFPRKFERWNAYRPKYKVGLTDWAKFNVPHYRSYQGRFLQVTWPNQQCQSTEVN